MHTPGWLCGVAGAIVLGAVWLTNPQSAAACWYCGIVDSVENIGDFFRDLATDLVGLTYNVITLDPEDAFDDLIDVWEDIVCPAISGFSGVGGEIAEALKNDSCDAPHGIAPEVLDKLRPYFSSPFDSVVIHEHCDFSGGEAITFGEHIYFRQGGYGYRPVDASGQVDATSFSILSHELIHVLQYRQEGFADFTCKYAQNCGLGAWIAGETGVSCELEQQAYIHQVLVFEDIQRDGDGIFTCVPDDQEWNIDNFRSHSCDGKKLRDNCPDIANPDQADTDGDGRGDACDPFMHPRLLADVNGDGTQDIVGFWDDGVYVSLSTGSGFPPATRWVDDYSYQNGGWRVDKHLRLLGDVNGDGKDDVVGFGDAGVYVALSEGPHFGEVRFVLADFGMDSGWRVDKHPRFLADVNGDGQQDIVGFGDAGVYVALSEGPHFGEVRFVLADFGMDSGWRVDKHPRFLADVNGDGQQDIVGFGDAGVYVALSEGPHFGEVRFVLADFGMDSGWRVDKHPRFLADVNGDGQQDIVGFGDAGVYVALSEGPHFGEVRFVLADFGMDSGWRVDKHPRFLADVNGDGQQDIVGFGDAGVYVALSEGPHFGEVRFVLADFGMDSGWRVDKHPRFLADVNGDGQQDIVGFGDAGVYLALSQGTSQTPRPLCPPQGVLTSTALERRQSFAIQDQQLTGRKLSFASTRPGGLASQGLLGTVGVSAHQPHECLGGGWAGFGTVTFVLADYGYDNGWQ